jgi:transglutaminase-like putative cysteine protease
MIYDIRLKLGYDYAGSAANARHVLCLAPTDVPGVQRVPSCRIDIDPVPEERQARFDFFGNRVEEFTCRAAHDSIRITLSARVERLEQTASQGEGLPLDILPEALEEVRDMGGGSPLHHLAGSFRVPHNAAMTRFARAVLQPKITAREAVLAVGHALHGHMRFDGKATTVDTPAAEAFARRQGVCQDFSHVMIACLRGVGVPAGYVSGFLRTRPPPGKPRLEGVDAMHAWVRAWCGPEAGWVEFDPTNDCLAGTDHIVVAYGRDYSDVAPIRGILRLSGRQHSRQSVDVVPVSEEEDEG